MPDPETGWLPDFVLRDGQFHSGLAFFVAADGNLTRFSDAPEDLNAAYRLRDRAVLPGLVNAHSHAFQRSIRARTEHRTRAVTDNFWSWREAMYHAATQLTPEDVYDVSRMAFLEMLASGITTVGEFHYLHHGADGARYDDPNLLAKQVLRAARETGIRVALLNVAYVRAGWQRAPDPQQARFITAQVETLLSDTEELRGTLAKLNQPVAAQLGIAPHSIRAVPLPYLSKVVEYARANHLPVHMHVAEQPAEVEASLAEYGLTPVALLREHGILHASFTAVHATHASAQEVKDLAQAKASICVCPTTERNLGDGIAPADLWKVEHDIGICFGTDSNIQIDLLEDARELEYHLRLKRLERVVLASDTGDESLARFLFTSATRSGARSLGLPVGELAEGKPADFFTVDLNDLSLAGADQPSLLSHVVFAAQRTAIRDVYVAGRRVIESGHHPEGESILSRFQALQKRLWR